MPSGGTKALVVERYVERFKALALREREVCPRGVHKRSFACSRVGRTDVSRRDRRMIHTTSAVAAMSVLGQSRPKWILRGTSAFPPIADNQCIGPIVHSINLSARTSSVGRCHQFVALRASEAGQARCGRCRASWEHLLGSDAYERRRAILEADETWFGPQLGFCWNKYAAPV
jgi:hypothetical protein